MRLLTSFFPRMTAAELGPALAAVLARRGAGIDRALPHEGRAYADLQATLARDQRLLTCYDLAPAAVVPAAVIRDVMPREMPWDPALARDLSAVSGGFGVAVESYPNADHGGLAVFFAGRTIELSHWEPVAGAQAVGVDVPAHGRPPLSEPERARAAGAEIYQRLTHGVSDTLVWEQPTDVMSSLIVSSTPDTAAAHAHTRASERPLALAVFPQIEAPAFAAAWQALENGPGSSALAGWRWTAEITPGVEIPYVLLGRDGPIDDALLVSLARTLDVATAAAIGLTAPGAPLVTWSLQNGAEPERTLDLGVHALLSCLTRATIVVGEHPGILRWRPDG